MRRKKTILAVVVAASLSLLLVLTQIGYLPEFLPEISVPGSLPAPDLSFLKPYGINTSFSELVVLAGAAFLFLIIGVGLGRAAVPQERKMPQPRPTTKPAPAKSEVKSPLVRPLRASPQAEQSKSLSAEDRLSRWLKEKS
jgi:hypothetical protein